MVEQLVYICEICRTPLEERPWDNVCPNCGRTLDCDDLPQFQAFAKFIQEGHRLILRPGSDPRDLLPRLLGEDEPVPVGSGQTVADRP